MFTRGLAVCLTLALVSVAQAGAVIELVPDNVGPYMGGETVGVDFMLTQDPGGADHGLRMVQFDMNNSDPALALNLFEFDFSAQALCQIMPSLCGLEHAKFEGLTDGDGAIVSVVYQGTVENLTNQILLPASGQIMVGHLDLTLPMAVGTYTLDALNANTPGADKSARAHFGFGGADPITEWAGNNGALTGGTYDFFVPEPATLALLALGGLALLRRRSA